MTVERPFLRWAGSKAKLLPKLAMYWTNEHQRYIEPFVGSAALYFRLNPKRAILSDINQELVHCYRAVRSDAEGVHLELRKLKKTKTTYLRIRDQVPDELPKLSRAARFLYLNRYCFNGLYRTNLAGKFNVPYAPNGAGELPSMERLAAVAENLQKARILNWDFERVIREHVRQGDFVYLDPPYAVENRRVFRQYGPQVFGTSDLRRLADCLHLVHDRGASFVLSYAYCAEARVFLRDWRWCRVSTQRNISGFARNRRRAVEMVVTNIVRSPDGGSRKTR